MWIKKTRKLIFSGCLGILIGFCYTAGRELETYDSLDMLSAAFYGRWLFASVLAAVSAFLLFCLTEYINKVVGERQWKRFQIPHWVSVLVLLLLWVPIWLSIFPGAFNYDANEEWRQVVAGAITSHHPVLHVLMSGGLVEGFHILTGSYNVGIAIYTILQMVLLANAFAVVLTFLGECEVPAPFQIFALVFWAVSPVVQMFAISVTKDTLFTAAELLFFVYVMCYYCRRKQFFVRKRYLWGFGLSALLTMILRNNGLYVVLIIFVMMAVNCIRCKMEQGRKFLGMLAGVLVVYGIYVGPVYGVLGVTPGGMQEMLSVPLQQMARVYQYDYESLEQEDLDLLFQVIPQKNLESYRGTVADFVKSGFNKEGFDENKTEFVKLWAKWLMEHPLTYVNSFLLNTVDFWYPGAVVDGYRDAYGKSSFFDYQVDEPGTEVVLLSEVHEFYEYLSHDKGAQKVPFLFLLLSPGWYLVMAMTVTGYLWCYKKYDFMVPMMILVLSFLTVLLGPIALVRYVLILYFVFPILLAIMFSGKSFAEKATN